MKPNEMLLNEITGALLAADPRRLDRTADDFPTLYTEVLEYRLRLIWPGYNTATRVLPAAALAFPAKPPPRKLSLWERVLKVCGLLPDTPDPYYREPMLMKSIVAFISPFNSILCRCCYSRRFDALYIDYIDFQVLKEAL